METLETQRQEKACMIPIFQWGKYTDVQARSKKIKILPIKAEKRSLSIIAHEVDFTGSEGHMGYYLP